MRRRAFPLDRLTLVLLVLTSAAAEARPGVVGGGARVGPAHGGSWVGSPHYRPYYRPWVGPYWGGWRYGYPGWGYGGWGFGLGYGAGWAVATGPAWGWPAPAAAYVMPSWVAAPAPLGVEEQVVEPPGVAAPPQAVPQQPGYWYYCTEPAGYYPYVNECSRPWIAVQPVAQ